MDGNIVYHKMVEEVQFLELMLDAQHTPLSRSAPKRTFSAPADQLFIDPDVGDLNILKSCPANVEQAHENPLKGPVNGIDVIKKDDVTTDSPAIPCWYDSRQPVKQQIACKPPPERKPSLVVNETPRGIGSDGAKSAVLVSKADQPQKPVAPPRKGLKLRSPDVERPIPAPRKKRPSSSQATPPEYSQAPVPFMAWEPTTDVSRSSSFQICFPPDTDSWMHDGNGKESWDTSDVALKHDSVFELDALTQELKHLCIANAQQDAMDSVLKKILLKSSSINEKYAIIDVSGLMERNKGNIITIALRKLKIYALNLLKPGNDRPPNWRKLDFSIEKFQQNVGYLVGFEDIFKKLGYEEEIYSVKGDIVGQKFPDSVANPNTKMVEKVLTDLCIAVYEIDEIYSKTHPHLQMLYETKQIPPQYNVNDSDSEDGDFEEENDKFVLAPSPKSYNDQILTNKVYSYEDPELKDGLKDPMEEKQLIERQREMSGLQQIDHDLYTGHPGQGKFYREQSSQSGFGQPVRGNSNIPFAMQAIDVMQVSDSKRPEQPFPITQPISTRLDWSPTSSNRDEFSNFQRPGQLSPLDQLNQVPNVNKPNLSSSFKQPNQDDVFSGSDQLSPLRQPKPVQVYNDPYQPSAHWQSEQRPQNSGLDIKPHDPNFHMQPHQVQHSKQIESSNRNFYSSDTTWVYSSVVSTPMKSGPIQQNLQNSDKNSMDVGNTRVRQPQIYGAEEEVSSQNTFAERDRRKNVSESYFQRPSIYCDVQPPFSSTSMLNPSHEQYKSQHSSNGPSQLPATGLDSDFRRMRAPWNEYQNVGPATYGENESLYNYQGDRLPKKTAHPGRISFEQPMDSQGYFPENGSLNFIQSHRSQAAMPAQTNIPSPPQAFDSRHPIQMPFEYPRMTSSNFSTDADVDQLSGTFHHQRYSAANAKKESPSEKSQWSCKHCTYINPIGTKVCEMCYKTSWESDGSNEPEIEILQACYAPTIEEFSLTNSLPVCTTVYDVRHGYRPGITTQAGSGHLYNQPDLRYPHYGEMPSNPYPRRQVPFPVPYRYGPQSESVVETPLLTQSYDGSDVRYMQMPSVSSGSYGQLSINPRRMSRARRSMSDHERKKQRELAERVRRDQKNQEVMERDAQELMKVLMNAENKGFDMDEVQTALEACLAPSRVILWLERVWPEEQNALIESYAKKCNDEISQKEARDVLIHCSMKMDEALEQCRIRREEKIKTLKEQIANYEDDRELDIKQALTNNQGDEKEALCELQFKLLEDIRESIFQDNDKEATEKLREYLLDKDIKMDDRTRIVLAQYNMKSWGRAEVVVKLIDKLSDERKQEKSFVDDCIAAANSNEHFKRATRYMEHECPLCYKYVAVCNMSCFLECDNNECQICDECFGRHVASKIENICKIVCPMCDKPKQLHEQNTMLHFQHLSHKIEGLVAKGWLAQNIRDIFEEKLRDFSVKDDPNFRWCAHCPEYGFLWEEPLNIKMYCAKCKKYTCFLCKEKWEDQHAGISCEEFRNWKIANDPDNQMQGLDNHLAENGITCPKCNTRYDLARGGCIHFTCKMCNFQFCGDCQGEFFAAGTCEEHPNGGIHGHHPRNCLYYLRDADVKWLQELLKIGKIEYDIKKPEDQEGDVCRLIEQKEEEDGGRKYDEPCGNAAPEGYAGLCEKHYKEYLAKLINDNGLDPVDVMNVDEVKVLMTRHHVKLPAQPKLPLKNGYLKKLKQIVKEKIPLQNLGKKAAPPVQQPLQQHQPPVDQPQDQQAQEQQRQEQPVLQQPQ